MSFSLLHHFSNIVESLKDKQNAGVIHTLEPLTDVAIASKHTCKMGVNAEVEIWLNHFRTDNNM